MVRKPARAMIPLIPLVEGFWTSATDLYASVEEAVKGRKLPGASLSRVGFKEAGWSLARKRRRG